jgi:hypothetical protein
MALIASGALAQSRIGYDVEEKEAIQRTFTQGAKSLDIDNLSGSIEISGYDGSEIQMTANKTIRARTRETLQDAKNEVKLDITEKNGKLSLYVDGPFRCQCRDGSSGFRNERHDLGYDVIYDFTLRVPRQTDLWLRTVNRGNIKVENTSGAFDVNNVNGGVELLEMGGSGRAYALNRPLKVTFSRNPAADSYFGSLNGVVDVEFQPGLSADLRFKTFNGHVYTDFETTALPASATAPERRDGKFIYRRNGFAGVRVGNGGPELKFDAFNGDVRIVNRGK